jgi:acetyl/propionyl-CoA carboxylase alpha subunit
VIRRYLIELGDQEHELAVEALGDDGFAITRNGKTTRWNARRVGKTWSLLPAGGGTVSEIDVDEHAPGELTLSSGAFVGIAARVRDPLHRAAEKAAAARPAGPAEVKSPMPGKVVRALVAVGDAVVTGQALIVVEAMKMENELKSPRDGTVRELRASDGQAIEAGQTLLVLG